MTTKPVSRRKFLKTAGLTLAASVAACSGLTFVASRGPQIETPDTTFGKDVDMSKRVLITYATRAGSTVEVANAMAETLAAHGFSVDVKPAKEKPGIDGYQAVLVGSAIRMGQFLPEAVEFVKTNADGLTRVPVAFFCVHCTNTGEDAASVTARQAYLDSVRPLVPNAVGEGFFAGKMDSTRLSLFDRLITKMVKSVDGDYRDWDKIRGWAETVLA